MGLVVREFDDDGRKKAINALLSVFADPKVWQRCVRAARKHFSLEDGVAAYDRTYRKLAPT